MRENTQNGESVPAAGATPALGEGAPAARHGPGIHKRLTLNSLSNVTGYVATTVITFFLTPFIVRSLGDSLYGFWVLLMSFIGYSSMLEMGIQPTIVRMIGRYYRDQPQKLQELLDGAFFYFSCMGLLSALVISLALPHIVARFVTDLEGFPHARIVFTLIAIDTVTVFMTFAFTGILFGFQMYYMKNIIDIARWIVNAALVVAFLQRGHIIALTSSKLGTDLAALVAFAVTCKRTFPHLRFRPQLATRGSLAELFQFGSRIFISATTTRLVTYAQPIIISTGISAAATTFFAIPARLIDYGRQMLWGLTTAFMPMFSELDSRKENRLLQSIYLNYSRYLFLLILPLAVILFAYGGPFIRLWIGPEYAEKGQPVLWLLASAMLVEGFQPLLWRFFIGVGRLNVLVVVSAVSSGLVILSSILLIKPLGLTGVAASVLGGAVLAQALFLQHSSRYLGIPILRLVAQVHLRPLFVGALVFVASFRIAHLLEISNYLDLLLCMLSTLVLHFLLASWIAFHSNERRWVIHRVRSVLRARLRMD